MFVLFWIAYEDSVELYSFIHVNEIGETVVQLENPGFKPPAWQASIQLKCPEAGH